MLFEEWVSGFRKLEMDHYAISLKRVRIRIELRRFYDAFVGR